MVKNRNIGLSSNETIRDAIQRISQRGIVNRAGVVRGTGRVTGYVAKIHSEGDLAGTIDVQEYGDWSYEDTENKIGYHEGVFISALQDNSKGLVIIPKMYSEVIVAQDPTSGNEFVTMYSHVDVIQLDSHERVSVGVREREPFDEDDENSPDVDELEETGVYSNTSYAKDSITSTVTDGSGVVTQLLDPMQIKQVVGDDKSVSTMTQDGIELAHDQSSLVLNDNESTLAKGGSKVKVEDGTVYVGSDTATDDAVLGQQLASILSEMLGYISQIMTTTMMGPQPPINVAAFISLKAKIEAFAQSHSGFLTNKVQIQK